MSIRIKTLCENTATFGFQAEWGLSMLVDYNGYRFLLDTGASEVALRNAAVLKEDLTNIHSIVLSHGHLDHTGGLPSILEAIGPMKIVAHPHVFTQKFSSRRRPPDEDISIPLSQKELSRLGAMVVLSNEPLEIGPGVFTSGEVPMENDFERIDEGLLVASPDGERVDDPLDDDLSVALQTDRGLFIILGCAHKGPVNIITHFQHLTGEDRVYGVVGGLHLTRASDERIHKTIDFFKSVGVRKVACSHCTGFKASVAFSQAYGEDFILNNSGTRLFFN